MDLKLSLPQLERARKGQGATAGTPPPHTCPVTPMLTLAPSSELGGRGSQLGHAPAAGPGDAELSGDVAPLLGGVEQGQQGETATAQKAGARACQGESKGV